MAKPFPNIIDLAALGAAGFKIQGEDAGDSAGWSVGAAGDVNDDGIDDVIVGAPFDNSGGTWAGAAYVVFGTNQGITSPVDLGTVAAGTGGFKIAGENEGDQAGGSVAAAGDVNGDGFADLIVGRGALVYSPPPGAAYVVFGTDQDVASPVVLADLDTVDGAPGFKIQGEDAADAAGLSVAAAGDVNDDGIDDLIVGAPLSDSGGERAGAAYVVFGTDQDVTSPVVLADLNTVNGVPGFKIQGESVDDYAGLSVAAAGDVNGDGIDDLIVGASHNDSGGSDAGAAYVVFGTDQGFTSPVDLAAVAAGTGGFKIQGESAGDRAGGSVAAAGDVNGDGIDDLIVGAYGNDSGGTNAGAAYVVFGLDSTQGGQGFASTVDLDDVAAGTGGFKIQGESAADQAGLSVSAAGDVNGDGIDDLIVGAPGNDSGGTHAGAAYVVFGTDQGFTSPVDLGDVAQGTGGFKIQGESRDGAGWSVSAAGDVDGDGVDDLIVGAPFNDAAYVIYGNIAPVAGNDSAGAAFETATVIHVLANDSDTNGTLVPASVAIVDQGSLGQAVAKPDGSITYTPNAGQSGQDSFTYTVQDDQGGISDPATVTVTIAPNQPPVAEDDSYTGTEDNVLAVTAAQGVLANDSDPENQPLTATVATGPDHGTLVLDPDGSFTYTPQPDYFGPDSFTYTASDGDLASQPATVQLTVTPVNDPPTALDDSAQTTILTAVEIPVLANDSDIDSSLDPASVTVTDDPANGTAIANPDGTVTYTPNFLFVGEDSFAYTVDDDQGATSNAATVGVTVELDLNPITGTNGHDFRFGTNGADLIQTLDGNDNVSARGGDDIVLGGAGNDRLIGEAGDDLLMGGSGADNLSGGAGLDILVGGPGNDNLSGGSGLDAAIFAGAFADHGISGFGTTRIVQDHAGDGGRDILASVELLQFDDGVFDARDGSFTQGGFATPEVEALVTSPGFTTDPGPILAPVA